MDRQTERWTAMNQLLNSAFFFVCAGLKWYHIHRQGHDVPSQRTQNVYLYLMPSQLEQTWRTPGRMDLIDFYLRKIFCGGYVLIAVYLFVCLCLSVIRITQKVLNHKIFYTFGRKLRKTKKTTCVDPLPPKLTLMMCNQREDDND